MRHTRFLLIVLLLLATPNLSIADEKTLSKMDLPTLRKLRKEAAHRQRRMIFNNDGDDVIYTKKEPTAEALLALRTTPLLGSQVDSIFYSNSLCFGDALHNSQVMEPFTCQEEMFSNNVLPELITRGIDPIAVLAEFCHQNGMEIFWDMRMNDTHDAMIGGYGPYLRPKFKRDNPQYIVGTRDKHPKCGTWTSVDYAQPEVRDLAYRFFEEVCRKFAVDGLEMDFFRHACFFKSVADGGEASPAERDMMTGLMRKIRTMTETEGMRRGRPIVIAIRVPDSVEYCQGIGLDVEKWLAEGLVDVLVGSGYFRLNRWEYLVDLGHRYGVPVYPCLSESRIRTDTRFNRNSIESYRGRAMRAWAAGADGIYIFNYFNPRGSIWRELGDPKALTTKDKLYFATVRDASPDRYLAGGSRHRKLPILTLNNPVAVQEGQATEIELVVGEDLSQLQREGKPPKVTCHLQALGGGQIEVALNGQALGEPTGVDDWLDYSLPPELVKRGVNRFALTARSEDTKAGEEPEWTAVCEGASLPATPWSKMGFTANCIAEVQDGRLLIADRGTESGNYAFFRYPCFINPSDETTVEVRLKVVSGWSSIIVENGVSSGEIQFYPDRVQSRHTGLSCSMDTSDDFHTYRLVIKDNDFKLFVDGELKLDGVGKLTHPAYNGRSGFAFGAANSPSLGEAYWESVKIRNRVRSLGDLVLSIQF